MTTLSLERPTRRTPSLEHTLLGYEFPAGFTERLSTEHGWTPAYTQNVLSEYRRFLVLAATAGQSVTPSRAVDAAWHEHLTHTRDYWHRLTPLLPAPLHHDPSGGTAGEDAHYAAQYLGTLALYCARFGPPDPSIWPDPGAPRPTPRRRRLSPLLLVLALVAGGVLLKAGGWLLTGVLVLGVFLLRRQGQRRRGGSDGQDGAGWPWLFAGFDGGSGDGGNDGGACSSGGSDGGASCGGGSCGSGCGGGCGS